MTDKEAQLKAKLLKMKIANIFDEQEANPDQKVNPGERGGYGSTNHHQSIRTKRKGTSVLNRKRKELGLPPVKEAIVRSPDKYKVPRELKHTRADSSGPLVNKVPFGDEDRETNVQAVDRMLRDSSYDVKKKVRPAKPTQADRKRIITAKEHHHSIVFKGHRLGMFRAASLDNQNGKYAKYWLLNAKQTNGNGWGIAAHTAKENMKKFIGRPLVVTASSWHGASEYGNKYEHPYLPTNDMNQIFAHQEKFRVGSIVDIQESNDDYYAVIEMLPKFANHTLPPFCSPAIYQLDAQEHEGNISKWEALHLAALDENPAYGARIALLKGTCIGTSNSCSIQFKGAKQRMADEFDDMVGAMNDTGSVDLTKKQRKEVEGLSKTRKRERNIDDRVHKIIRERRKDVDTPIKNESVKRKETIKRLRKITPKSTKTGKEETKMACPVKVKERLDKLKKKQKIALNLTENVKHQVSNFMKRPEKQKTRFEKELFGDMLATNSKSKMQLLTNLESTRDDKILKRDEEGDIIDSLGDTRGTALVHSFNKDNPRGITSPIDKQEQEYQQTKQLMKKPVDGPNTQMTQERATRTLDDIEKGNTRKSRRPIPTTHSFKLSKLKLKLANLGEQNMTYQKSKKIKIHKKKYPEVRKAKSSVEDILRGKGRSVDGSHHDSTFLSTTGDFIGGGSAHDIQAQLTDKLNLADFQKKHGLIKVQRFPINRAGEKRMSVGINSKINKTQLKSILDLEKGGHDLGFAIGPDDTTATTGRGTRDLTKALREHKFI